MADEWVDSTRELLEQHYREAIRVYIEVEVFLGRKDCVFIREFEHVLFHLAIQILDHGGSDQLPHLQSHLQRIILEGREYVAEETLVGIEKRMNPYRKWPKLAAGLMIERPPRFDEHYEEHKEILGLIRTGRCNKGHEGRFDEGNAAFREAMERARKLDEDVGLSKFNDRLFAALIGLAGVVVGFFLSLLV